jgi:hypothetical protein
MAINFLSSDVNSMYPHVITTAEITSFHYVDSSPDSSGVMWYEINVYVTGLQIWIEEQPENMWCEGTPAWGMPSWAHVDKMSYLGMNLFTRILHCGGHNGN